MKLIIVLWVDSCVSMNGRGGGEWTLEQTHTIKAHTKSAPNNGVPCQW